MDARVGYPNEHLTKGMIEEVKSPMCSTGVGLVINGFLSLDRQNEQLVASHSQRSSSGKWIDSIIKKGQEWLLEDDKDFEK
ncbi:MAG: hypothetical protein JKY33_03850 [Bacteroidia bacterium]|nr:hypothetical protein [Bacteroidia bacterium]